MAALTLHLLTFKIYKTPQLCLKAKNASFAVVLDHWTWDCLASLCEILLNRYPHAFMHTEISSYVLQRTVGHLN